MERMGPIVESYEELAFEVIKRHPGEALSALRISIKAKEMGVRLQIDTRHAAYSHDFVHQLACSLRRSSNSNLWIDRLGAAVAPFRSVNDDNAMTSGPWMIWFEEEAAGEDYASYKARFFDSPTRKGISHAAGGNSRPAERKRLIVAKKVGCIDLAQSGLFPELLESGGVAKVYVYQQWLECVNDADETHRIGGPAIIGNEEVRFAERGRLHRSDGPAVIGSDNAFYIEDEELCGDDEAATRKLFVSSVMQYLTRTLGRSPTAQERASVQAAAGKQEDLSAYASDREILGVALDLMAVNRA